ncbi:hypothetical protein J5N97_011039 [Dioscorea zingiberensis]|uniref:Prolyl 4-hydroxylase alpha subunit domain-containing protein n=1 Tax=Dioscorea zingiberensis TaxID=325984 RepID=A0A9D5D1D1_9LILI|nr:hypothetical protein J5N97_011039 [Dioscorea zingiberensis]
MPLPAVPAHSPSLSLIRSMLRSGYIPHVKVWSSAVARLASSPDDGHTTDLHLFDSILRRLPSSISSDARPDPAAFNAALNDVPKFLHLSSEGVRMIPVTENLHGKSSRGPKAHRVNTDLFRGSKRRVPNGPDPIHNRNEDNIRAWGNRIATVLMYLSNVGKGGETIFPLSEAKLSQKKDDESWSECAMAGYSVKAVKGDALLFFNLHPNQSVDLESFHGSCPVIHGQKWTATKWINTISFDKLLKERNL